MHSSVRPRASGDPEQQTRSEQVAPGFPLARERTGNGLDLWTTFTKAWWASRSLNGNAGRLHQCGVGRDLVANVGVELLRPHQHRLGAELGHAVAHVLELKRLRDLLMQPVHDCARRL